MDAETAINILEDMQSQIIHGKRTFGDIADLIRSLRKGQEKFDFLRIAAEDLALVLESTTWNQGIRQCPELHRFRKSFPKKPVYHFCCVPDCTTQMSGGSPDHCPAHQPFICKECKGRGKYIQTHNEANSPSTRYKVCRTCKGKGIIKGSKEAL